MKKESVWLMAQGWSVKLLTNYKEKFKEFFKNLKLQFKYNDQARAILITYMREGRLSKDDTAQLKQIVQDTLKMVGLGTVAVLPIPGTTILMLFLLNSAKKVGIDLIPSQFKKPENKNTEIEE